MRTLRDFLLAEATLREGEENKKPKTPPKPKPTIKIPSGFRRASVSGQMSKTGIGILKDLSGDDGAKYSDVKLSDLSVKHIKKQFGVPGNNINDLGDLCSREGLFSKSAAGAKIMQQLFTGSDLAAAEHDGVGGYIIDLHPQWGNLADTPKSSEKLIMFWLNSLYNVYVNRNVEKIKLRYFFDDKSLIVQEP